MLKLVNSNSFNFDSSEPQVSIINLTEGFEKKAAHEDVSEFISKLQPKEGFTYLHINAMTAGDWYSSNRNGDYFPEENLKKYFKTFETTPAHVFRHHINKQIERSYGKVIFAIYNERMHRVELIAECPNELVEDVNSRISAGDFPTTSMACRTPYDTCSICGNKARSRQEYCNHLKFELNKLYPDGRKVFAINDGPLTFFDISIVVRPADVNSSILTKVAETDIIGSAELAEIEGLNEGSFFAKKASMKKFSEFIKEIDDGIVTSAESDPLKLLTKRDDLPLSVIPTLSTFNINEVLTVMAELGISPSISFLAELLAHKHLGEGYSGIGDIVSGMLNETSGEEIVPVIKYEMPEEVNNGIYSVLRPHVETSSLLPSFVEKRSMYYSNIGYAGNGPHIEPTQEELMAAQPVAKEVKQSYGKMLLQLGVAALLAKWYITNQIEKKLVEKDINLTGNRNTTKIILVKKASDYVAAANLARVDLSGATQKKDSPNYGLANSLARRILIGTKTRVGGKLAGLLRLGGLGIKVKEKINEPQ